MYTQNLNNAKEMVKAVKSKSLDTYERIELAINLAAIFIQEAKKIQTKKEKKIQEKIAKMMHAPYGKVFTTEITDQCFRTSDPNRVVNQFLYILDKYGIPTFLPKSQRLQLVLFKTFGKYFSSTFTYFTKKFLRNETSNVIIPGENKALINHIKHRKADGVKINLNHLGEAILGEKEARKRLNDYIEDLKKPEIDYISIKISTIYSQINLLDWSGSLEILSERLRELYRTAINNKDRNGNSKFVNLDMEEYRDLHLTVELFKKVLNEEEFLNYAAGIVLQSYLPDSFVVQKEITEWAIERKKRGGAPIKIRIVKGANLAMEILESSLEGWPQAPYTNKADVDANYKRMVQYGTIAEHAEAAHLGIASHNLFDIAYALILRSENHVENYVIFEMLEGMADHQRRIIQSIAGSVLLYCPSATKEEFVNAVAYLVRRLDENTAPENFLRHSFDLTPQTPEWDKQAELFRQSCLNAEKVYSNPRREQNRFLISKPSDIDSPFENEPNTDWSLANNRKWIYEQLENISLENRVPLMIHGREIWNEDKIENGFDPSNPGIPLYQYTLASVENIEEAVASSCEAANQWAATPYEEKNQIVAKVAQLIREKRGLIIKTMMADSGKTIREADAEISEAIDFCEYYRRSMKEILSYPDIEWSPKGVVLVTPPWNFPFAIPLGGVISSLIAGNSVLFKPAKETLLTGWMLAKICWEAGIPKDSLQFIACEDDPIGSLLIKDPRINTVILTGATDTAKLFMKLRPGLDLIAETGGKNSIIVSKLCDKDLAIKHIIDSAFSHSGQKCSACSLAILDREIYDDTHFLNQLKDAAESLSVGSSWNFSTKVSPLIQEPRDKLLKALTTLEEGESWLLEPKQDPKIPTLWSPGIKLGVKNGGFTQQNELFGPVLGLIRAENFEEALSIANNTRYGLTAGIHSLDEREQKLWTKLEVGNCYINRGITGAIVQRQPFGGCKESSFGRGAKAGGPNYLTQVMKAKQKFIEEKNIELNHELKDIFVLFDSIVSQEDLSALKKVASNYYYYWKTYFSKAHDPTRIIGQDNFLKYVPSKKITLRISEKDSIFDIICILLASMICHNDLEISYDSKNFHELHKITLLDNISWIKETEDELISRLPTIHRLRLISEPSEYLIYHSAHNAVNLLRVPVLTNGRFELLNYLREISVSWDYHRYGNVGLRENEERKALPVSSTDIT